MPLARSEIRDAIGVVAPDHPARHNALGRAPGDEPIAALEDFRQRRLRVAILRAAPGAKVWSAGHDVDELPVGGRDPFGWDDPLRELIRAIEQFPAPVLAMVEGGVWGGACETALACDLVVAAPSATFAITPARLGVPYHIGGMLTFLNAAIEAFTFALAADIAANAPLSIAVMKEQLRILAGAHPMSPQDFERVQGLRRLVYDSHDYRQGIHAFKEKRAPRFTGD